MDPYEILGLKYPCSKSEIKQRYHELAKKHHPDKLSHLSDEECKKHEEQFKKINVAYELLNNQEFQDTSHKDWKGMWSYMEQFMKNPDMSKIFTEVIHIAKEYKKQKGSEHHVKVPITLEEVHQRKEKKLRLFLKNIEEPIFIQVDCVCYPNFLYTYITPDDKTLFIHIEFILKEHEIYSLDEFFSTHDLLTEVKINLYEYFAGCSKTIYDLDGKEVTIQIPKYCIDNITIPNKGLHYKGSINVMVRVQLPSNKEMEKIHLKNYNLILEILRTVCDSISV